MRRAIAGKIGRQTTLKSSIPSAVMESPLVLRGMPNPYTVMPIALVRLPIAVVGTNMQSRLRESIDSLVHWVEDHNYAAYDPGDGNNSFLHALTFNNLLLE